MRRISELDALRGLAALVVVLFHLGVSNQSFNLPFGWAAVDLFFVLSGYLITSILLRHRPTFHSWLAFYGRRALRIWPIYYIGIAFLLLVTPFFLIRYSWDHLVEYLLYLPNLDLYRTGTFAENGCKLLAHVWTLGIEEQFYLLWPLLLVLVGRRGVVPLALVVAGLSTAARAWGLPPYVLVSRCDGLALGALLAGLLADPEWMARHNRMLSRAFGGAILSALAYVAWFKVQPHARQTGVADALLLTALNTGFFGLVGLVVCHTGCRALAPLRWRPLCHLGLISYGLYFYHNILINIVHDHAEPLGYVYDWRLQALIVPLAIGVAQLSWVFIECPILRLKDRLPYDRPLVEHPATSALEPGGAV